MMILLYQIVNFSKGAGNSWWMLEFMCKFTQDLMMSFGRAMRDFALPPPPSVPLPSSPPLAEQKPSLHRQNTLFTKDHSYKNFQPLLHIRHLFFCFDNISKMWVWQPKVFFAEKGIKWWVFFSSSTFISVILPLNGNICATIFKINPHLHTTCYASFLYLILQQNHRE